MEFSGMNKGSPQKFNSYAKKCPTHVGKTIKNKKDTIRNRLEEICKEYDLKRNQHFPNEKSPNLFMTKLNMRLKIYYTNCMKASNLQH